MVRYALAEASEIQVSIAGKDSPSTRQKAIDRIAEMSNAGELPAHLLNDISIEDLILVEVSPLITGSEEDDEEDPLIVAVRELSKFSPLKIKTQRLKQAALESRRHLDVLFVEEGIEQDLDQVEEILKGSFKTFKEFAVSLVECRKATPGAEKALAALDEALGLGLLAPSVSNSNPSSLTEAPLSEPELQSSVVVTEAEATTETTKNGRKRRP
jgi:hypothetical protein